MNILVSGGVGFIGSHVVTELLNAGHNAIIVDDLSNSEITTIDRIKQITGKSNILFYQEDVTNEATMKDIFSKNQIDGIIHLAGYKSVGESVSKPLLYYQNNILATIILAKMCLEFNVANFVFSSSATVYGDKLSPLREDMVLGSTTNPYGESKVISEKILSDLVDAHPSLKVSILRYFNPVGAHSSGLIGEKPKGIPNNLMPYITMVASGQLDQLKIFGDDYDTVDGSGVRDYIHVVDLAKGHLVALEGLKQGLSIYNLGTGRGTSVFELVETFQRVNQVGIPYQIVERRPGDIATCYADTSKIKNELGWEAKLSIEDMVRDSWRFFAKQESD
ncbi:UDP-glucose 4-epimerase GalE [Amphibacillus sediminis]|uniref:UDP-glucose 4-epimerase GalE n=1 Tax=Amphibacillus sediminis TaxID=360185 RepID=UPI000834D25E|nr:UDP-glucose 4-epimerase GalE [Amphibacillus sediminis]